jgi:hypothetical protein
MELYTYPFVCYNIFHGKCCHIFDELVEEWWLCK